MEANRELGSQMSQMDLYADQFRMKLPAAPAGLIAGYVRWAPWVAIIFGAIGFLATLALFTLGAALSPLLLLAGAEGVRAGAGAFVALAFGLVGSGLDVAGGYLMLQRRLTGWWLIAAGLIIGAINGLLSGSLLGLVFTLAIGYVHLQAKPEYR